MVDVIIKILQAADTYNLLTTEQARMSMQMTPDEPGGSEDYLNFLIEQNSDIVSRLCNRVFAREHVRETWRCIGEPCDCADAKLTRRLFLSHWPVHEVDIDSIEVPRGYPVDQDYWELDEQAGRLSIFYAPTSRPYRPWTIDSEPIVVTYWGGFELPDEAPPALRYAAMLLVSSARTAAQRESQMIKMAGIKSIGHKSARVTFETGSVTDTTGLGAAGPAGATTPAMAAVKDLLSHFMRFWV